MLNHPKGRGIQRQRFQLECTQWLADRGFGKAVLSVEHTGAVMRPWEVLKDVSTEDLQSFLDDCKVIREEAKAKARAIEEAKANVIEGQARMLESRANADE